MAENVNPDVWDGGATWNSGTKWKAAASPVVPSLNMATNQTRALPAATLSDDKDAIAACKKITTYTPQKEEFNQAALDAAQDALKPLEDDLAQKKAAHDASRDNLVGAQWVRHNLVLGMRTQIKAQFGEDSNELQAVGLKKKSEYKRGGRRKPAAPAA